MSKEALAALIPDLLALQNSDESLKRAAILKVETDLGLKQYSLINYVISTCESPTRGNYDMRTYKAPVVVQKPAKVVKEKKPKVNKLKAAVEDAKAAPLASSFKKKYDSLSELRADFETLQFPTFKFDGAVLTNEFGSFEMVAGVITRTFLKPTGDKTSEVVSQKSLASLVSPF